MLWRSYRVFIKYCVFSAALVFYLPGCVDTLTPREYRERPESGIFKKNRKKTQYLMNTLCHKFEKLKVSFIFLYEWILSLNQEVMALSCDRCNQGHRNHSKLHFYKHSLNCQYSDMASLFLCVYWKMHGVGIYSLVPHTNKAPQPQPPQLPVPPHHLMILPVLTLPRPTEPHQP